MAGRCGVSLCQLGSGARASILPGATVRGGALRSIFTSARCFSEEEGTKPPYTNEYFQGVTKVAKVISVVITFASQLVKNKPLVVFMKGDPSAPMVSLG